MMVVMASARAGDDGRAWGKVHDHIGLLRCLVIMTVSLPWLLLLSIVQGRGEYTVHS